MQFIVSNIQKKTTPYSLKMNTSKTKQTILSGKEFISSPCRKINCPFRFFLRHLGSKQGLAIHWSLYSYSIVSTYCPFIILQEQSQILYKQVSQTLLDNSFLFCFGLLFARKLEWSAVPRNTSRRLVFAGAVVLDDF